MSISSSFNNALSGLTASGRLAEVTSNNLANALTKGYGRQSVDLGSVALGGGGAGVNVVGVTRETAPDLTAARRQTDGETATLEPQAEALARLGQAFGEATDTQGLFLRVQDLENGFRLLSSTPESQPRQIQVAEAARDLTTALNSLSDVAASVRQSADAEIGAQVQRVNANLQQIDRLNAKIVRLDVAGREIATLVDERERLIDEVNALIPARTHLQDDGSIHLTTNGGLYLLAETPSDLSFQSSPIITAEMMYDPAGSGGVFGLTLDGQDITPSGNNPQRLTEGAIAGSFLVRDEIAVEFNERIDGLAADLISRFEDPAVDPTLAAGNPGLFTDNGNPLDLTIMDGLAGRIDLNALVDTTQGGDPARLRDGLQSPGPGPLTSDLIPRAYADAFTAERSATTLPGLSGNLSMAEMVSGVAEITGVLRTNAETSLASQTTAREALAQSEAQAIGVNTDAELQFLIQIEQSFSANIQVIQTASRMLEEIMEIR